MRWRVDSIFLVVCIFLSSGLASGDILVPESAEKRVLVPQNDIGLTWRVTTTYNDDDWQLCSGAPGGVGYETGSGYEPWITLDVREQMYESSSSPNTTCYVRIVFDLTQAELDSVDELYLLMRYDDGFSAFLNGRGVARSNAPRMLRWDSAAEGNHEAESQESFNITDFKDQLRVGKNLLAIHALNVNTSSSDFLINAELVAKEDPFRHFKESNLPLVFIDTNGQFIRDEPKINAHMGIVYHGVGQLHNVDEAFNDYDGTIGIEWRGSSSQSWPKKQYAVETRTETGENNNVSLMGLPVENDWILNAPFIDKSLMRNVLAYDLSRRMGHYASRTRYCELFLNGEYQGIYILMEKIKRDNDRVDIAELDSTDLFGNAVTGGYILKIDKTDGANNEGFTSRYLPAGDSDRRVVYQYHDPEYAEMRSQQIHYIQNYIHEFEEMMASDEFNDPVTGYPAWIDIDSFIDFLLVSEIAKNVDSYRLSTFFYKDRNSNDSRLHAGPIWDYNLGFGLANYYDGTDTDDWMISTLLAIGGNDWQVPFWWEKLVEDPVFYTRLKERWADLRQDVLDVTRIHNYIDAIADTLDQAQQRNFMLWSAPGEPGEGFWPVPDVFETFQTYQDEVDYLKWWIEERIEWMDQNIKLITHVDAAPENLIPEGIVLQQNYPNPFNPSTTIRFNLPQPAQVRLDIYNLQGQLVRTLLNQTMRSGSFDVVWDGESLDGGQAASGVYTYRLSVTSGDQKHVYARKMLMMK